MEKGEQDSGEVLDDEEELVSVERVITWGEKALRGEFSGDLSEYEDVGETVPVENSTGESDPTNGVILDLNDNRRTEDEKVKLMGWLEDKLGAFFNDSPIEKRFISDSGESKTTVDIFSKKFGTEENPWYFSRWQNEGEHPSYILWGEEMYDMLEFQGFEPLPASD